MHPMANNIVAITIDAIVAIRFIQIFFLHYTNRGQIVVVTYKGSDIFLIAKKKLFLHLIYNKVCVLDQDIYYEDSFRVLCGM